MSPQPEPSPISSSLLQFFRTVVPLAHDRTVHSTESLPQFLAVCTVAYGGYILLAYWAHISMPRLYRLALLPFVALFNFHRAFGYRQADLTRDSFTWASAVFSFFVLAKSIDFTFASDNSFKRPRQDPSQPPNLFFDAVNSAFSMRGLECSWSRNIYVPPPNRSSERGMFLWQCTISLTKHFLIFDMMDTITKFRHHMGFEGDGILQSRLPVPYRYLASLVIVLTLGQFTISSLMMDYEIFSLVGVGLFRQSPADWPPAFDSPWKSTSLQELWSRRWHQAYRRTLIVLGGRPGYWLAGRVGFVLGAFFASGWTHEFASYTLGYGLEWSPILFFTSQGVFVLLEKAFERVCGKKVRGWPGRVWTFSVILGSASILADTWIRRFYGPAVHYPLSMSLTRRVLKGLGLPTPEGA